MKMSVSLPNEDVDFLDAYARRKGIPTRSAALRTAIRLLRAAEMGADYVAAWDEWSASGDETVWDASTGDGLSVS